VHIVIFNIMSIRLLIIMGAESSEALVTQVRLNWVNAANQDVESAVKLLLINNQRIVNIALDEILVMERRLGQVSELFQQDNAVTATALRRFGDERLSRILPQVVLKVPNFVRQQETVRHKLIIDWEEPLQPTYNNTEYILLSKVVH
jgi:hypothetical protein